MRSVFRWVLALMLAAGLGSTTVRAEEEEAKDPTRGGWDAFLDPVRDAEDGVTNAQKSLEDSTKIHVGAGITKAYTWDFNDPRPGTLPVHSLESHDEASLDLGQLSFARPSEGWFIPGFGVKLDFGKVARRIKSDWDGDGTIDHGETFETSNFDAEEVY